MAGSGIAHMRGCPVQWGSGVAALLLVTALPCGVVQRVSRLGPDDSRLKGGGSDGSKKEAQVRCTRSKSPVRRAGADRRHLPPAIMPASRRAMSERMTTRASLLSKTLTVTIQLRNLEEGRADTDRASAQHRMCAIATNRRSRSSDEHPLPPVLRRATSRPAASCWLALERPQCRLGRRLRIGASEIVLWREDAERVGGAAGRLRNDTLACPPSIFVDAHATPSPPLLVVGGQHGGRARAVARGRPAVSSVRAPRSVYIRSSRHWVREGVDRGRTVPDNLHKHHALYVVWGAYTAQVIETLDEPTYFVFNKRDLGSPSADVTVEPPAVISCGRGSPPSGAPQMSLVGRVWRHRTSP